MSYVRMSRVWVSLGPALVLVVTALKCLGQNLPYAHTQMAGPIFSDSATLTGMGTPNGLDSAAWFEWGANAPYGQTTSPTAIGNGTNVVRVTALAGGLEIGGIYQYRLVVSNAAGVSFGAPRLFTTGNKAACWGSNDDGEAVPPAGESNLVSVSGNSYGSLGLRNDGTVVGWGYHPYVDLTSRSAVSNAMALAMGWVNEAVLKSDGQVAVWGSLSDGLQNVPADLTNAIAISAGHRHLLALRSDGTVTAWGYNGYGQTNVPAELRNVVGIAAGVWESFALKHDGTVVVWGGQTNVTEGLTNVVAIAGGDYRGYAIKDDGAVVFWNYGSFMQSAEGASNAVEIAGGGYHSLAIRSDGSLATWVIGTDNYGVLSVPPGLTNVAAIAGGAYHSLAISPNAVPQAFDQLASGSANRDLVLTLGVLDANNDPLNVSISSLPAAGSLYQYGPGGVRGAQFTTPGTVVADPTNRVIFAPEPDAFGNPYATIAFQADDGAAVSDEGLVTVEIVGNAYVSTSPATKMRTDSAQLNGFVTPNGLPTDYWFEWGTNLAYGQVTAPVSAGNGYSVAHVNAWLTNLVAQRIYYCRLVASNAAGVVHGARQLLTTGGNVADFVAAVPPGISNVVGIARGADHLVTLRNDGTAVAWGGNGNGQTNVPPSATNLVQVKAGYYFNLALRDTGTLMGWGRSNNGQLSVASGNNFVEVAAGAYHGLGLRSNGTVAGWGAVGSGLNFGQVTPPAGLSNVVAISAGVNHSLALKDDGTVVAWGDNYYGQISVPPNLTNIVAISAGLYHSLALRADGTPVTWGTWNFQTIPLPSGLGNVVAIAAGRSLNVVLTEDGVAGAAGAYPSDNISVPAGLTNIAAIGNAVAIGNLPPTAVPLSESGRPNRDMLFTLSASDLNSDALHFRIVSLPVFGALYQYDDGQRGAMIDSTNIFLADSQGRCFFVPATDGFGSPYDVFSYVASDGWVDSSPVTATVSITAPPAAATRTVSQLELTNVTINGLASSGGLPALAWFQWGTNANYGETTAPMVLSNDPGAVPVVATLPGLALGLEYHCRLVVSNAYGKAWGADRMFFTRGHSVWAWGPNTDGQTDVPLSLTNAIAVAAGGRHGLALLADGTVAGWGSNEAGQSVAPDGLSNVVAIAAGAAHSLALRSDGIVVAWGTNGVGQTNVPVGLVDVIAIAAGANHSLALRNDGTVVRWGYNADVGGGGATNVVAIAAGFNHSVAARLDGSVVTWGSQSASAGGISVAAGGVHNLSLLPDGHVTAWGGSNPYGEITVPAGLGGVIALAAGTNHSIAVLTNGALVCWGRNDSGQCSPPANLGRCVAISSRDHHTVALATGVPAPYAMTLDPKPIRASTATLTGVASANGGSAFAWFEWGTNAALGQSTMPVPLADDFSPVWITSPLNGLQPFVAYRYRLVVSNAVGVTMGRVQHFTTGGRLVAWGSAVFGVPYVAPSMLGVVDVAAGSAHSGALLSDGTVRLWGTNSYGQLSVPTGATNLTALAAGGGHTLALRADGCVLAWGRNIEGQTNVPVALSNAIAIAAGDRHSLALRADGTVVGWGYNGSGQTNAPPWLTNVVAIAAAGNGSMALRHDGVCVVWGSITNLPASLGYVTAIAVATNNTAQLKQDGQVVVAGSNYRYQTNVPFSASNLVAVALGAEHGAAVRDDGQVVAWGGYWYNKQTEVPVGLSNVVALAAASYYNLTVAAQILPPRAFTLPATPLGPTSATARGAVVINDTSGQAWFEWGTNGTFAQATVPTLATSTSAVLYVSAPLVGLVPGGVYSCRSVVSNSAGIARGREQRFTTGRKMLAWGYASAGVTNIPPGLSNVVAVACGLSHSVALLNDGTVRAWGAGGSNRTNVPPSATNVIAVAAGSDHSLALRADGTIVAWGLNSYGQTNVPAAATNIVGIACGQYHSLALRADGRAIAWGNNSSGQTNVPGDVVDIVALAGGGLKSLALLADGTVRTWGAKTSDQTHSPDSETNLVAVAAGGNFNLGLRGDGSLLSWGGIAPPPPNATNIIAIAAGSAHALALGADGVLIAWGSNSYGQTFTPVGSSNFVNMAAGQYHTLAVGPNRPPIASSQSLLGEMNRDLMIVSFAQDPNGDATTFRVSSLPSNGTLYQYLAGDRGAALTAPDTTVLDPVGRLIFAPEPEGAGWPYASFELVANDGEADSDPAMVTVNVIPAPVLDGNSLVVSGEGQFSFSFLGDSNASYRVWSSTNLANWIVLGTATQSPPGHFQFTDSAATNKPVRFYRVTSP